MGQLAESRQVEALHTTTESTIANKCLSLDQTS